MKQFRRRLNDAQGEDRPARESQKGESGSLRQALARALEKKASISSRVFPIVSGKKKVTVTK
jgi:hypothetical protein